MVCRIHQTDYNVLSNPRSTENMKEKIFRSIFWLGYMSVLIAAFIPLKKDLHTITLNIFTLKLHFDQVLHTIVYFLICLYFPVGQYFGLTLFKKNSYRKYLILILMLATVTEAIQLAVPYRAFNLFDLAANLVGIGMGLVIFSLVVKKRVE